MDLQMITPVAIDWDRDGDTDLIVGDEDGVVVVPSWFAKECLEITKEHEDAEAWVKEKTVAEDTIPGKYYGNNLMENYHNRDK